LQSKRIVLAASVLFMPACTQQYSIIAMHFASEASKYASKRYLLAASIICMPNLLLTHFNSSRSLRAKIQMIIFCKAQGNLKSAEHKFHFD